MSTFTLTQDFTADCKTLLSAMEGGTPFAFSRYSDGEGAVLFGYEHLVKSDHWRWGAEQQDSLLGPLLMDSLIYDAEGWYVGITGCNCNERSHRELMKHVRVPHSKLTISEVFMFANWTEHFNGRSFDDWLRIGYMAEVDTPREPDNPDWADWKSILDKMLASTKPIALCAGPWSCVLAHHYWKATFGSATRQMVIDFGCAITLPIRQRRTRRFQHRKPNEQTYHVPYFWPRQE